MTSEHGCNGGWVYVASAYAQGQANLTTEPGSAANDLARRAHQNTVYPCRVCNRSAFFRWQAGHFNVDHDRSSCAECQDVRARRRPRTQPEAPMGEPPPDADPPRSEYGERERADTR